MHHQIGAQNIECNTRNKGREQVGLGICTATWRPSLKSGSWPVTPSIVPLQVRHQCLSYPQLLRNAATNASKVFLLKKCGRIKRKLSLLRI